MQDNSLGLESYIRDIADKYELKNSGSCCRGTLVSSASIRFATGITSIDQLLGNRSVNNGFIEISGEADSGKTALALAVAAVVQQQGGRVVYFDIEGKFDNKFAELLGVGTEKLIVIECSEVAKVCRICEMFLKNNSAELIIIDSLTAVIPDESDNDTSLSINSENTSMRKYLQRLYHLVEKSNCHSIFVSQQRANFNKNLTLEYLSAIPYFIKARSWLRLKTENVSYIYDETDIIGSKIRINIVKNSFSICRDSIEVDFSYDHGF